MIINIIINIIIIMVIIIIVYIIWTELGLGHKNEKKHW